MDAQCLYLRLDIVDSGKVRKGIRSTCYHRQREGELGEQMIWTRETN